MFGQTGFGASATPVFGGNTSLFNTKPAGTTPGGLFGNTGTGSAFGQPATTQSSFGAFGNTNTNANLFGAQPTASTNLFGTTTVTPAFGQANKPAGFGFGAPANTGLFGQTQQTPQQTTPFGQANKPAGFGFGGSTNTSLFGQPQQATQQTTPFGQTNTSANTSLFGSTPGFGATNNAAGMTGTYVKFAPVTGTDSMMKNGVTQSISTRHHCITCMKEYEGKSLEELRLEDYNAGRKGGAQGQTTTGLFGAAPQASPFGSAAPGANPATSTFGSIGGGFGVTSQPGGTGLFNKPITGFGAPATTTSSFAFNSTPSTNLFGASTQAKPFGAAAPAPLFSTTSTAPTATGFGTNQTAGFGAFGAAQPNQSIGLFNQNKSAFTLPASSASTGFGGFGQTTTTNTGTNLFGAKPAGTTGFGTTSAFGGTPAPAFGTNIGFGATPNTNTSLFNNSFKPAGQTTGFSFGNTGATTALGANPGLNLGGGTSLFNQQKPGGLFGSTGAATGFNNTGAFGASTGFGTGGSALSSFGTNLMGGMGTNQVQPNANSVPVHQQILALVSAPFGDSPLLKNLLPASGKTEELLKPMNPTNRSLNSPQYKVTPNNNSPKIKARVVTSGHMSKKSLFEGLEEEDPALLEAFQPRPNAKRLVLRPKTVTSISPSSPRENTNLNTSNLDNRELTSPKNEEPRTELSSPRTEVTNKENEIQETNRRLSSDRRSSTSWLKSTIPRKKTTDEDFDGQQSPFRGSDVPSEGLDNTVVELRPNIGPQKQFLSLFAQSNSFNSSLNPDKSTSDSIIERDSDSGQDLDETPISPLQSAHVPRLSKVKLQRVGYYTIPSLEKLDDYVCGETCVVPNFTVGRKGYGNVYFPDSFDVYGLNLDEIVHFRHKEVIIYPDDEKKPAVGQGLNRKAQVTLDRVWPHDKSRHEPITDPHRLQEMNYEVKLRQVSAKHDTRFLEYRPETGSWVFKVDHFSKYGLSDSDDEEEGNEIAANDLWNGGNNEEKQRKALLLKTKSKRKSQSEAKPEAKPDAKQTQLSELQNSINDSMNSTHLMQSEFQFDRSSDCLYNLKEDSSASARDCRFEKQSALSPTSMYARIIGTDSHKLQLMKADLFDSNGADGGDEYMFEEVPRNREKSRDFGGDKLTADYHKTVMEQIPMLRSNLTLQGSYMNDSRLQETKEVKPKQLEQVPSAKPAVLSKVLPAPVVRPKTVVLKSRTELIPFKDSIIYRLRSRCIADAGIQMGRMFKPSWGPGLTLISLSTQEQAANIPLRNSVTQLGSYISGRFLDDMTSTSIVQRLQILGGSGVEPDYLIRFKESVEGHLRVQLEHCVLGQEGDCPAVAAATGDSGIAALHAHCNLAQEFASQLESSHLGTDSQSVFESHIEADKMAKYSSDVWRLCVALWGNLPDIEKEDDKEDHKTVMVRKEALSDWLKSVVEKIVRVNLSELTSEDQIMFELLTANKLDDACALARKVVGDHCLALLMSQLGGATSVRELIKQQLALWQDTDVDGDLSIYRLKLFMIVAGEPLICSKQGTINVCESLDWKRALALHLWYLSQPTASITDALEHYEGSFNAEPSDVYAVEPRPEYFQEDYHAEISNKKPIYDLCFHLLKLYCTGNHPLEEVLNPLTHTADPLDYRLSWLTQQMLVALGYSHLSDYVAALTHANFAAQLETYDLWHWAIFVVLHLQDSGRRRSAVLDLLARHVELDESENYVKRENFLREELGIPSIWINQAKAVKACAYKRYGEAAWYLTKAEQWNKAHEVIIENLAADAIINENYDYLKSLLSPLMQEDSHNMISGWAHQGQLLWDYIEVTSEIKSLLQAPDCTGLGYKLELLQPQLTSLCSKINLFPCPTAKHRLCQAEIAKRTLQLARSLLMLQSNDNKITGRVLVHLISQLPLPEDYAQQELRPLINMCAAQVVQ
ncbi:nuclear pore complex protein Nup98-Nup96-like [Belonocnema kinseyi]|uniref:nuclear pore complex protein Nup98-Nup96-like n=1 Tax=Belonocnema kinseyi TaxID=2817044 RepID=UPI00143D4927|nr:nuclear pore complex protein Nup98-Nup96-like [Belonocnema kinseyi]